MPKEGRDRLNDAKTIRNPQKRARRANPASSFLVRCWLEPRETAGTEPVVRVTVRNLQTGEEQHLSDPRQLGDRLLRHLGASAEELESSRESG